MGGGRGMKGTLEYASYSGQGEQTCYSVNENFQFLYGLTGASIVDDIFQSDQKQKY